MNPAYIWFDLSCPSKIWNPHDPLLVEIHIFSHFWGTSANVNVIIFYFWNNLSLRINIYSRRFNRVYFCCLMQWRLTTFWAIIITVLEFSVNKYRSFTNRYLFCRKLLLWEGWCHMLLKLRQTNKIIFELHVSAVKWHRTWKYSMRQIVSVRFTAMTGWFLFLNHELQLISMMRVSAWNA